MKKRSAALIAAGLVLAMGIGAMAVSLGLTGPTASNAAARAAAPVVRVERRTVTVQRNAEAIPGTTISAPADDSGQGEGSEDEGEHEAHEVEFESEDD
jgi:hypothetical protein